MLDSLEPAGEQRWDSLVHAVLARSGGVFVENRDSWTHCDCFVYTNILF